MKALGIHIFAGGFTVGVQKHFEVKTHLETHGFGLETAQKMCGVETINVPGGDWPDIDADFAYGNPRCTAFSTITGGYADDTHGAWAKQTCDIHEFAKYTSRRKYPIIIWESVQQAYTTGKELIDHLVRDIYVPAGYRVAHLFINATTFGNTQNRKRYFFVAYDAGRNFNVTLPVLKPYKSVLADVLHPRMERETREFSFRDNDYDENSYIKLTPEEKICMPHLIPGTCLNQMGEYGFDLMPKKYQERWTDRMSDMPFSMHGIYRLRWNHHAPTLHSSACRFIHPHLDRPITVGEQAAIMGWPTIPVGPVPTAQIAKGVCPEVGEWLALQAKLFLQDHWGTEDYETSYNDIKGEWVGRDTPGENEKVFNITRYSPGAINPAWESL